jgi:hypothetical protein
VLSSAAQATVVGEVLDKEAADELLEPCRTALDPW